MIVTFDAFDVVGRAWWRVVAIVDEDDSGAWSISWDTPYPGDQFDRTQFATRILPHAERMTGRPGGWLRLALCQDSETRPRSP